MVRRVTHAALIYYEKFELLDNGLGEDEKKNLLIDLEELVNLWLNNDDTLYVRALSRLDQANVVDSVRSFDRKSCYVSFGCSRSSC